MNKILRYSLMSLLMLVCGSIFAQDAEINFKKVYGDKTSDSKVGIVGDKVVGDITMTFATGSSSTKPAYNKIGEIRLYCGKDNTKLTDGNTFTVKGKKNITRIQLTAPSKSDKPFGTIKASVGTVTVDANHNVTWTGDAQEVTFTSLRNADKIAEPTQLRYTDMAVYYVGTKVLEEAGLQFSEATVDHELGTTFVSPTFTKKTDATVTFTTDNAKVATVSAEGVITLAGAEGKAVITASCEATNTYKAGTTTCTIYVNKYNTFKKATAIESGKKYLMVAQRDGKTIYGMSINETYKFGRLNGKVLDGTLDEIKVSNHYDNTLTFEAVEGGFSMKDYLGRYFYFDTDAAHDSFQLDKTKPYAWTVEAQADGTFKIMNNNKYIQYGKGTYTTFSGYTTAQDKAVMPMLFVLDETASGIQGVNAVKVQKNNVRYNLAGQRVDDNFKGIVIVNGKKMLVK